MEPSLLIALVLAFGIQPNLDPGSMTRPQALQGLWEVAFLTLTIVAAALIVSLGFRLRVRRRPDELIRLRRAYLGVGKVLAILSLGVYAYILFQLDWISIVKQGLGFDQAVLADEILILAPFLLARFATWWSLYPAEQALRQARPGAPPLDGGSLRYLTRRARQSVGLVLPAVLIYALGNDLLDRFWPRASQSIYTPVISLVLMGVVVMTLSPALVRLTWPMRRLPEGPLRDRLERLARRMNFRYSDILVWQTEHTFVNAGVTGALPWFRYVLLTDTLIESLEDRQIEAVFGHEMGHILHRHLAYFGCFFVGSLGVVALAGLSVETLLPDDLFRAQDWISNAALLSLVVKFLSLLGLIGLYFYVVFGYLSRYFERQADLAGCRAVSCGSEQCPPHRDINASDPDALHASPTICPVGIRIFANALSNVARFNGMDPLARSWRHGSIAYRIGFLESLEGRPESEIRFERKLRRFRLALGAGLLTVFALAVATGALDQL